MNKSTVVLSDYRIDDTTEKNFCANGIQYILEEVSAIETCNLDDKEPEYSRKGALLCTSTNGEGKSKSVIFGFEMPETEEEFAIVCKNPEAWESDNRVLETIIRKQGKPKLEPDICNPEYMEWLNNLPPRALEKYDSRKGYSPYCSLHIGHQEAGCLRSNPAWYEEDLYRTHFGEYFFWGRGREESPYSRISSKGDSVGLYAITVISHDEAKEWAEKHLSSECFHQRFVTDELLQKEREHKAQEIEGLQILREIKEDAENWICEQYVAEQEGTVDALRPRPDYDAACKKYPRAAAYLIAEQTANGNYYDLASFGAKALNRILDGEDCEKVIADMRAEKERYTHLPVWEL